MLDTGIIFHSLLFISKILTYEFYLFKIKLSDGNTIPGAGRGCSCVTIDAALVAALNRRSGLSPPIRTPIRITFPPYCTDFADTRCYCRSKSNWNDLLLIGFKRTDVSLNLFGDVFGNGSVKGFDRIKCL